MMSLPPEGTAHQPQTVQSIKSTKVDILPSYYDFIFFSAPWVMLLGYPEIKEEQACDNGQGLPDVPGNS